MNSSKQTLAVVNWRARCLWGMLGVWGTVVPVASNEQVEPRFALVIGNAQYENIPHLEDFVNNAQDIRNILHQMDFQVTYLENTRGRREIQEAVNQFSDTLMRKSGVGLFYYSGHAMQIKGENYLIPVSARISSEADVEHDGYNTSHLTRLLQQAKNSFSIVILNTARENPLVHDQRSRVAEMDNPTGSITIFTIGSRMLTGNGRNHKDTYAKHLLNHINNPVLMIQDLFTPEMDRQQRLTEGAKPEHGQAALAAERQHVATQQTSAREPTLSPTMILPRPSPTLTIATPPAPAVTVEQRECQPPASASAKRSAMPCFGDIPRVDYVWQICKQEHLPVIPLTTLASAAPVMDCPSLPVFGPATGKFAEHHLIVVPRVDYAWQSR
ncbi:MAG: caspase family protein [Pseudomonadota bacterium]